MMFGIGAIDAFYGDRERAVFESLNCRIITLFKAIFWIAHWHIQKHALGRGLSNNLGVTGPARTSR